jgi:biotin operon repressor
VLTLLERLDFYAAMLKARTFTPSALAVAFMLLYRHQNAKTGRCDPATATLAEETGLSERTVKSAVEELRNSGWWQIGRGRGRGHTNSYMPDLEKVKHASPIGPGKGELPFIILPPEKVKRSIRKGEARFTRTSKNQESDSHTVDAHAHRAAARSARARARVREEDGARSAFETFWRIYPHRGAFSDPKKPAREKFDAAVKRGVDPAAIIAGAEKYRAHIEQHGTEARFVAQAKTWLNEERWAQVYEFEAPPRMRVGMN